MFRIKVIEKTRDLDFPGRHLLREDGEFENAFTKNGLNLEVVAPTRDECEAGVDWAGRHSDFLNFALQAVETFVSNPPPRFTATSDDSFDVMVGDDDQVRFMFLGVFHAGTSDELEVDLPSGLDLRLATVEVVHAILAKP